MIVIGYRVNKKFDSLNLDQFYEVDQIGDFLERIRTGFNGLVLFHGDPHVFQELPAASGQQTRHVSREIFAEAADARRCAFLIFSTSVIPPPETPSNFIHCYTVGISKQEAKRYEPLFQNIISQFRQLDAMPDEDAMQKLWAEVDPYAARIKLLRLLEDFLWEEQGQQVSPEWQRRFAPYYDSEVTYAQLVRAYRELTERDELKKN